MNAGVRFALDMGPLLVFFVCYRFAGLMAATAALMVFTLFSLTVTYLLEKRISPMPLVTGIAVAIFGGMTLWLHNDLFIKIKPTLVNLLFAGILFGGLYFKRPMLKYVLGQALHLDELGWFILTRRWGLFFVFLAILNECVWRNFPTEFWVSFKVFGMFTCTVLFMLCQLPLMKRHAPAPEKAQ